MRDICAVLKSAEEDLERIKKEVAGLDTQSVLIKVCSFEKECREITLQLRVKCAYILAAIISLARLTGTRTFVLPPMYLEVVDGNAHCFNVRRGGESSQPKRMNCHEFIEEFGLKTFFHLYDHALNRLSQDLEQFTATQEAYPKQVRVAAEQIIKLLEPRLSNAH